MNEYCVLCKQISINNAKVKCMYVLQNEQSLLVKVLHKAYPRV